jgi:hypothetical protein
MATNNKDFRVKNGLVVEQDTNIGGNLVVTGTITGDGSGLSGVTSYTSTDFAADLATKTTTNLAEGTNLYYTTARFDTALATKDTDDLTEGTNLYYTTARANSDFDSRLALKSTSDLTEGTNLYYTNERVDDRVSSLLVAGTNVSLSYDDNANTLTISANDTSVALGTDTTGNYIATVAGTTNQVTVSGSGSESAAVTLSLPQDIHTGATPQFAGATLTAALAMSSNKITGLGTPTASTDAATKQYVDEVAQGIIAKPSVRAATTTNLSANYNNGTLGVGATLTADTNRVFTTLDGVTNWAVTSPPMGVLVKNQTNSAHNGRYNLTTLGSASTPWVLTKCGLCDEADEIPGAYVFVSEGTQAGTGWVQTVLDPETYVVGTDAVIVTQFSGAGTYTAGTGLTLTGSAFSVNAAQTQITSVGTLTGGTWNASVIAGQYGGTGVANTGKTITIGGNFTTSGAHTTTLTTSGNTNVTLPTTGTLATLSGTETFTNKTISGTSNTLSNIGNASLTNSSLTIGSTSISLGATATTLAGLTSVTSTTFVGALTGNASTATTLQTARTIGGVSFNGSANINLPGVNTAGNQNTTGSAATLTTTRTLWGQNFNGSANVTGALSSVTTLSMTGQLTNTIATGTAPLAITSTTRVANLNVATAGTADTLTTARTIGGVSFNGSANINLPGVNTGGNQNTSGTAAVSTAATITTSATASAFKVPFANTTASTTGNYGLLQDSEATFTYNPSTNTLTVGTVAAALTGNASTATSAATLTTARTINTVSFNGSANIVVEPFVENDDSTNATRYITFVDSTTAGHQRLNEDSNFTINPSTGTVTTNGGFAAPFLLNKATITDSYTIPTGFNAVAAGPVVIADGITVTVPDGSVWTIV